MEVGRSNFTEIIKLHNKVSLKFESSRQEEKVKTEEHISPGMGGIYKKSG